MLKETSFSKKSSTRTLSFHIRLKKTSKEIKIPDADEDPNEDQNQKGNEDPDADENMNKDEPPQSVHDWDRDEPTNGRKEDENHTRMTWIKMKMSSKLLSYACIM